MPEDWSELEVDVTIADYFSMLFDELSGKPYNKTEHRRRLHPLLNNRNESAIEYKHRNISAALINLGAPYIKGYKPLWNYQKAMLDSKVAAFLDSQGAILETKFESFVNQTIAPINTPNFSTWLDVAPIKSLLHEESAPYFRARKVNYLEKEQRNQSLGDTGEEFVWAYEKWRLNKEGKSSLADKIEWISRDQGDGAGFDILSKNNNGTDRYIEVKSTKLAKETPFFFSKTEFDFSKLNQKDYWVYRVFNIHDKPKMYQANGRFDNICFIEAQTYKGYF